MVLCREEYTSNTKGKLEKLLFLCMQQTGLSTTMNRGLHNENKTTFNNEVNVSEMEDVKGSYYNREVLTAERTSPRSEKKKERKFDQHYKRFTSEKNRMKNAESTWFENV